MDITNYTWVNSFGINENPKMSAGNIVIITISVILGTAVLIGVGFLTYKWKKMKQVNDTLAIPGTLSYNNPNNQCVVESSNPKFV